MTMASIKKDFDRNDPAGSCPILCSFCGIGEMKLAWMEYVDGRRAIRRTCSHCGQFRGFAPQTPENIRAANASLYPAALLDVLTECEQAGIALASCGWSAADFASYQDWKRATPVLRAKLRQCRHSLAKLLGRKINER